MSNVKESAKENNLYKTYKYVLSQKEKYDAQLVELNKRLLSVMEGRKEKTEGKRKYYVPRKENSKILLEAIFSVMLPQKEMTMLQILKKLSTKKAYNTNSRYLYTMVNNKLNRQSHSVVGPIRRGVFVYKPNKKQMEEIEAYCGTIKRSKKAAEVVTQ